MRHDVPEVEKSSRVRNSYLAFSKIRQPRVHSTAESTEFSYPQVVQVHTQRPDCLPGPRPSYEPAAFVRELAKETWRVGMVLTGVLTNNGPEFIGQGFRQTLEEMEVTHHRIPPRSPDHNAVVERFHGTVLQECYRPAFHRRRFDRLVDLKAILRDFLDRYNRRRRNHGDYMRGRTPAQMLEART